MNDEKTYDRYKLCRNFDTAKCPHRNHEALKSLAFDIPLTKGQYANLSHFYNEEIINKADDVCSKCSSFEPVKRVQK